MRRGGFVRGPVKQLQAAPRENYARLESKGDDFQSRFHSKDDHKRGVESTQSDIPAAKRNEGRGRGMGTANGALAPVGVYTAT